MMLRMMILTVLLMMTQSCQGFLITKAEPGVVVVSPGERVTLFCAVDDHYEWCKWFHPGGQFCDFEWKRSEDNITMQECALHDRISFHGAYDDKECGITFTATDQDTGLWKCEIEEYVTWRSRGAGRLQTAVMNVTVQTPTPPPSPPTSPSAPASPPTSPPTSLAPSTQDVTTITTKGAATDTELSSTTSESSTLSSKYNDNVAEESESPEAEPQVDDLQDTKAGSSYSVLISVVAVLIVIVILISGAVYYRRRRSGSPASAVYEKEARTSDDKADMVRNSNSNITFHSGNAENSNLHEYFPPNLTYSTVTPESQA